MEMKMIFDYVVWGLFLIIITEILAYIITKFIRKNFQWFIVSYDQKPILSVNGLKKFFEHGFDAELGWIRKSNSTHSEFGKYGKTCWTTNDNSSRHNPDFEKLKSIISCYGDSFAFCRQVNDNETWEHYLSELTQNNVLNFGVGNYGIDQAILRLEREFSKNPTEIVILCVVPDTIRRILNIWKHYFEYGNTFGFKPRFIISENKLKLIKNPIDDKKKFENYQEFLQIIQKYDYFYKNKFSKEIIKFPYIFHLLKNPRRNISIIFWVFTSKIFKIFNKDSKYDWYAQRKIMRINLKWRVKLFSEKSNVDLFIKIIEYYLDLSKSLKFKPILLILPQKDDVNYIKNNFHFYENTISQLKEFPDLEVIDATQFFLNVKNLDELYSDQNEYGGHLSKEGNKMVSFFVYEYLKKRF
jgi:hypothetical protein